MNDRDALLMCILEHPEDDLPRLVYADWLEENGDPELAEFVRIQCELSRVPKCEYEFPGGFAINCRCRACELRRRERELWNDSRLNGAPHPWFGKMGFTHTVNWLTSYDNPEMMVPIGRNRERIREVFIERGFVSRIKTDWHTWLSVESWLVWVPGGTVAKYTLYESMQPVEIVELTTAPFNVRNADMVWIGSHRFTREKCPKCDGRGSIEQPSAFGDCRVECPDCHGRPLNSWTCDSWPMQRFVIPELRTISGIGGTVSINGQQYSLGSWTVQERQRSGP